MAKRELNDSQWVDQRLAGLDDSTFRPDAERGMQRFAARRRKARLHLIEWVVASSAGLAALFVLTVFLSPGACAKSRMCSTGATPDPVLYDHPAPAVPEYKVAGSAQAPVVCELYTDYQCPSCAMLYRTLVPELMDEYVRTGKVRLVHRDFPLTQHQYARLAARYANAAGMIGHYDAVVQQIFLTQNLWETDGNVDAQVMQVLTPEEMQQVRDLVNRDVRLDQTVDSDRNMGLVLDHVDRTPFLVVVKAGKRMPVSGVPQMPMLRNLLDGLLAAH